MTNIMQTYGNAPSADGAPVAAGVLDDLVGRPLFLALYDYFSKYGGVYKLAFGPKTFMICSDPAVAKHILRTANLSFDKGVLAEILEPIMGKGLIPADFETWKTRRRAIVPGFHSASIATKLVEAIGGATVLGPVVLGLSKPVQICPLSASVSQILNMATFAAYDVRAVAD